MRLLVIEDSGPGIPPEVDEQMFTPFFTTKKDGNGIGLALIAETLSNHGFEFSLEGSDNQPTRFTIVLS